MKIIQIGKQGVIKKGQTCLAKIKVTDLPSN